MYTLALNWCSLLLVTFKFEQDYDVKTIKNKL